MSQWQETVYFVGNVPFDATEPDLTEVFKAKGHRVSTVKIARDVDGVRSRGFGFVTILTDDPDAIIKDMYGVELNGRCLRVDVSTSKRSHGDGGPA